MINTEKLRKAVQDYVFTSTPSSANHSDYCSVADIRKVIDKTVKLLNMFIDEIENNS